MPVEAAAVPSRRALRFVRVSTTEPAERGLIGEGLMETAHRSGVNPGQLSSAERGKRPTSWERARAALQAITFGNRCRDERDPVFVVSFTLPLLGDLFVATGTGALVIFALPPEAVAATHRLNDWEITDAKSSLSGCSP